MARTRMHADEITTDPQLVRRLLAGQFPEWADLPVLQVESYGTDHDIYRVGDRLSVRLPRIGWAESQAAREAEWLPRLAPHLPLAVPGPLGLGRPAEGYPFAWSVHEWLPGENANGTLHDLESAAVDLAGFVRALRRVDTSGAHPRPRGARGAPLAELDASVRRAVTDLGDRIDGPATLRSWAESLAAPAWTDDGVWVHGDLLPGNLLVVDGRLSAVIDFGGLNVGDPACDLQPAWNVFAGASRDRFRAELAADDATWLRGRGWALAQAVIAMPYYWDTNPGMIRQTSHALRQVLADGTDTPVLRRAEPHEADALTALTHRSKAHWGYPRDVLDRWRDLLTITAGTIRADHVVVAERAGVLLGYYRLHGAAPDGELADLFLDPPVIGTGLGRTLWEHAVATARERGFRTLTWESDPNAEPFYRHLGAERIGGREVAPGRVLPIMRTVLAHP
ncbi:GNAT family N-acetyltransferase [Streptomyces sp. NPDC127098]|uniref:GNAT family N-acetyltransferase n=1 Tax=Streptomyces sp. NPDC127098 TaxID=3347137 RepID=UPI00364DE50D